MMDVNEIIKKYPLFLLEIQPEDKFTRYILGGYGNTFSELISDDSIAEDPGILSCVKTRAEVEEALRMCINRPWDHKWMVLLSEEDEPKTKKSVIPELVEKGIVTMEEGEFIHNHMKSQNRTEYTFERDKYTITIKIHKEEYK